MAGEQTPTVEQGSAGRMVSEWFWRFLAAVMMVAVGWVAWIVYQLSPPPLVTQAAYEAAARARAGQTASGAIGTRPGAEAARPGTETAQPDRAVAQMAEPDKPPVNVERLRLSDTIRTLPPQEPDGK